MAGNPTNIKDFFVLEKNDCSLFDWKLLLLVGGLVLVFFVIVYPALKNEKFTDKINNVINDSIKKFKPEKMNNRNESFLDKINNMIDEQKNKYKKEHLNDYTLDAGCGIPEKKPEENKPEQNTEHMSDIQKATAMSATGELTPGKNNDDINNIKVDSMVCSKACCSPQWGVENPSDDRVMPNDLGSKYYPTNYMCNGENPGDKGHGCVCINKDGFDTLGYRGGNNTF